MSPEGYRRESPLASSPTLLRLEDRENSSPLYPTLGQGFTLAEPVCVYFAESERLLIRKVSGGCAVKMGGVGAERRDWATLEGV